MIAGSGFGRGDYAGAIAATGYTLRAVVDVPVPERNPFSSGDGAIAQALARMRLLREDDDMLMLSSRGRRWP